MAKGTADDGGAATGTGQEKASGKGAGGDAPAVAGEELLIRAPVHCDGCGRKLRRSLQRLEGVGEVTVDSRTNTVLVRGRGAVENATEVVQVVERRTREKAVLVSPSPEKLPPPPRSSAAKGGGHGEANDKKDDANTKDVVANELPEEVDMEMVTVVKMNLHCDACSQEIKRRITKIAGVEEAVPHLKSSQVMVKGKVEPATLVGFIHKCTGRRAAIIRAEPLDDLLRSPNPPAPAPSVVEAESKKDDPPPENPPAGEEKKNGGGESGNKKEEPNEENKGGQEDDHVDENPETEKPSDGGHGAAAEEAHPKQDDGGNGLVLENHTKDDRRLFTVPMPAGVVTVAPPEMALGNRSYFYPPEYPSYAHPYQQYQYHPQAAYSAYGCSSPAAMYGYGYPANYPPPEAFCEENPNACNIV